MPKYVGRCILNSLNRYALPVETPTSDTRAVVVVDQFGLKQNLTAIREECVARGYTYWEDSPYGLAENEKVGPGSLARFIGLAKILPIVQGAILITEDKGLWKFIEERRREQSLWSWMAWGIVALLRVRPRVSSYSAVANLAYEMYLDGKGGNQWMRGNIERVLKTMDLAAALHAQRLAMVCAYLDGHVLVPDLQRLCYVVPFFPGDRLEEARAVFGRHGFDTTVYHVEVNRNLFAPRYVKTLPIPLNSRIPNEFFESLVTELARVTSSAKHSERESTVLSEPMAVAPQ